jgi:hypothetical protein
MAPVAAALAAAALFALGLFQGCSSSSRVTAGPCIEARVGGKAACLGPGKRCSARHERIYRSYGLTCREGVLRQRSYIGPANP